VSGKRLQIDHDSGFKFGLPILRIKIEVLDETFGKFRGQSTDGRELFAWQVKVNSKWFRDNS
jgi:hypothetical protein